MLTKKHSAHFAVILPKDLLANRMSANVVRAKALHTVVVDEAVVHDEAHVLADLLVRYGVRDEAKSDREAVSLQLAKMNLTKNALK